MPGPVAACAGSPLWSFVLSGVREGRPFATKVFMNGGMGATAQHDGANVLSWPSNVSATPVEMVEQLSPMRFSFKRIRTDSGGAGQFRGGNGQEMQNESVT